MWIKLHFIYNNDEVYVESNHITTININSRGTVVSFIGNEDNFITVRERPSDILKLMQTKANEFIDGWLSRGGENEIT